MLALTAAPRLRGILVMKTMLLTLLAAATLSTGCAGKPDELTAPEMLVAPYNQTAGKQLWAVAPLRNESGVSTVDTFAISDALVARSAEVRGIACLPLNRTIAAMRAMGISSVRSPAEARALARTLGADAIVVGSVTAYDPYDPPKIGLTLGLYPAGGTGSTIDTRTLTASGTDAATTKFADQPSSVASEYLDAANHEVLINLRRYATGRHQDQSALGWKRYTASMELYTDFAAYWSLYRLLQQEQLRIGLQNTARK
jgi:hypothetical protein